MNQSGTSKIGMSAAAIALAAGLCGFVGEASAALVQTINLPNFNDASSLTLNGTTAVTAGLAGEQQTLSLTTNQKASVGTAYHTARQQVDLGFRTDFKFRIRDRQGVGSDGLSFIVQNQGVGAMGGSGGAIGFGTNLAFPTGNTGIANSLAVVFDTWDNSANWPTVPGANVITAQTNGTGVNTPSSVNSLNGVSVNGAFNDGAIHQVRIIYVPGTMQIYYDNLVTPALVINNLNLANTLSLTGGAAFVGFTAATGAQVNVQRHEILDWQFSSEIVPAPGAAAVLGLGALGAARRRRR